MKADVFSLYAARDEPGTRVGAYSAQCHTRGPYGSPRGSPPFFAALLTGHVLEVPAMGRSCGRDHTNDCRAQAAPRVDWCRLAWDVRDCVPLPRRAQSARSKNLSDPVLVSFCSFLEGRRTNSFADEKSLPCKRAEPLALPPRPVPADGARKREREGETGAIRCPPRRRGGGRRTHSLSAVVQRTGSDRIAQRSDVPSLLDTSAPRP